MNTAADAAPEVLRISIDAKATVKVGPFARGGKSRSRTKACDHDFKPTATVTPLGIFLPASDELFLFEITSKVTSDRKGGLPGPLVLKRAGPFWPYYDAGHQSG